jgi:UDP-N-acetylglucosamine 2-epimerase (non-hydrolysing)
MAPVAHALASRGIQPTVVLTGQHPGLVPSEFGLGGFAAIQLSCPGECNPHDHVRAVSIALLSWLAAPPDLLVVQGDTSSALGGALAGFMAGVPVAHVEAGLRTHDPLLPWPEEEYRVAIDAQAELLFAPTETAAENLRGEAVSGEVYVTGNTGIDALLAVERAMPAPPSSDGGLPRVLVTCHRRESWRAGLGSIAEALRELAKSGDARIDVVLHPNPHVAAKMTDALEGCTGILLLGPSSHSELLRRIRDCDLVLSDSGGIQEEAPALGTPLLVLREKTERPEAISSGSARLVGTSTTKIIAETRRLLADPIARAAMSRRSFPFGDGQAGIRIATVIEQWLGLRPNPDQSPPLGGTG